MKTFQKAFAAAIAVGILAVAGVIMSQQDGRQPRSRSDKKPSGPNKPVWHRSLPDALAEAQQEDTFVLVDAYADWCGWCKKLEADTLSKPKVQAQMQAFTLLKVNTDKQPELAQKYSVAGLPTTLILDAKGEVIRRREGYMPPKDYLQFLAEVDKQAQRPGA